MTERSDALTVRAERTRDHLRLRFGVETNMARYSSSDEPSTDEFPDTLSWHCRIVRNHNQIALTLAHELFDDAFSSSNSHEAADHKACAVRYHGDRIFNRDGFHGPTSGYL